MFRLKKISLILIMIIFTWLALPGPSAIATVDVTTSFVSFTLAPEPRPEIPGRIAGISLFNVIVVVLLLLMAAAMTKLIIFVKQKYGRQPAAPISKRKKLLLFAGALLITLLLHFAAAILHNNIANGIPEAVHDGFKVVSTPFFTAEIPLAWQLEALDGAPMFWRINKDGDHVGEIMFIPYFTEHEEPPTGDGFLYASLSDETLLRRVLINVSTNHADQTILDKITGSFKMVAGPKTSVDMQTAAQRYVRTGGREIFGKIEEVVLAAGNPVGILIKEKQFILDDEAPSGFRIETLPDAPAEYPVAPGANVLPLVPPHYTSHGAYYMPPLKDFIANYNYKDNFYIFIAGADGEIKMILQRYVP